MGEAKSTVQVDLDAVGKNVQAVREAVGKDCLIMVVVKDNAYGHGEVPAAKRCLDSGADRLGVADVREASRLRQAGIQCPIHILGTPTPEELSGCIENNVVAAVTDVETARAADDEASRSGKKLKCHVLVDTGMARLGPFPDDAVDLITETASLKNIELEGAFTHFHTSSDAGKCRIQLEAFLDVVERARSRGVELPILHAAAGGAMWRMAESHLDMVRPGLCVYGLYGDPGMREFVELCPAMTITSKIVFMKTVPEGTPISYGGTCVTQRSTVLASIRIGYGDGYSFHLANKGWVGVEGKRASILGAVTMDYIMVDVTDIPGARVGSDAAVLGGQGPAVEELADLCKVVPYEIVCRMGGGTKRGVLE